MRKTSVVLVGAAVALLAGSVGSAFAQQPIGTSDTSPDGKRILTRKGAPRYRPLTVQQAPAPVDSGLGGPIGIAGGVAGGIVTGAASLAVSPLQALGGAPVGISPIAAPPLPIKARYAGTGKVTNSIDEGYAQDVPVDASGPIYQIDGKSIRTVTPFTLAAFPITGLASAITTPLRPATP